MDEMDRSGHNGQDWTWWMFFLCPPYINSHCVHIVHIVHSIHLVQKRVPPFCGQSYR
jgi:hypothetical protein